MLSYLGCRVSAIQWSYWNSRDIVVKWHHCCKNMTSSYVASQRIQELLGAFSNMKMRCLMMSKKKNPLVVWGWDRRSIPRDHRLSSHCTSLVMLHEDSHKTDFPITSPHSWWILHFKFDGNWMSDCFVLSETNWLILFAITKCLSESTSNFKFGDNWMYYQKPTEWFYLQ